MLLYFTEFVVIHNGIITNYKDVKAFLVSKIIQSILMKILSTLTVLPPFLVKKS